MKPVDRLGLGPTRTAVPHDGGWLITVTPPAWSGIEKPGTIVLSNNQYERYQHWLKTQRPIQTCLADLRPWQREILMTGIDRRDEN